MDEVRIHELVNQKNLNLPLNSCCFVGFEYVVLELDFADFRCRLMCRWIYATVSDKLIDY